MLVVVHCCLGEALQKGVVMKEMNTIYGFDTIVCFIPTFLIMSSNEISYPFDSLLSSSMKELKSVLDKRDCSLWKEVSILFWY